MGIRDVTDQLRQVPLFSTCSRKELEAVAHAAKEVSHDAGHVIARQDDPGVGFFLITEGEASVAVGGKTRTTLVPGDFFGEISLLDRGPRSATVTAATPIRMLGLTAWQFRALVDRHPRIAFKMLEELARRLQRAGKEPTN